MSDKFYYIVVDYSNKPNELNREKLSQLLGQEYEHLAQQRISLVYPDGFIGVLQYGQSALTKSDWSIYKPGRHTSVHLGLHVIEMAGPESLILVFTDSREETPSTVSILESLLKSKKYSLDRKVNGIIVLS